MKISNHEDAESEFNEIQIKEDQRISDVPSSKFLQGSNERFS